MDLLTLRNVQKARKPFFLRQDAHKRKKLAQKWRQPKGMDSKMRIGFRSRRLLPSHGYSSPREVRGLNRQGFEEVLVLNVRDLDGIDPKTQIVLVGHIGKKKKIEILKKCAEKQLAVAYVRDINAFIKNVEEKKNEQKKLAKERTQKKKTTEDAKKKDKKEENKEAVEEETKKGQKSDKIKALEKRE